MGFRNMYIAASAGSGKTYQLVNRFIALLSIQQLNSGKPDVSRLIAVTFTRKAAGEFKERILAALAEAAQNEKSAGEFWNNRIWPTIADEKDGIFPGATPPSISSLQEFFSIQLRHLTDSFSELKLSTLDSFFQQMVTTLAPELGLNSFSTLEKAQQTSMNRRSLDLTYLHECRKPHPELEAAINASFADEDGMNTPDANIFKLVSAYHEAVLNTLGDKDEAESGKPKACWGGHADEMSDEQLGLFGLTRKDVSCKSEADFYQAVDAMRAAMPMTAAKNWHNYVSSLTNIGGALATEPKKGWNEWLSENNINLGAILEMRQALYWRRLLSRTHAIYELILKFEDHYKRDVRSRGLYSFNDVLQLLRSRMKDKYWECMLLLEERTDASIDHWMLDEFQDTSWSQYDILFNLLHNRATAEDGSLFMVGDAKQSIYQFRGGDPHIFLQARSRLFGLGDGSAAHEDSAEKPLNVSQRSTQPVLDLANDLFGNIDEHSSRIDRTARNACDAARKTWTQLGCKRHETAERIANQAGCATVWRAARKDTVDKNYPPVPEVDSKDHANIMRTMAAILKDKRPEHEDNVPGCAILVGSHNHEKAIYKALTLLQPHYHFKGPIVVCNDNEVGSDSPAGKALSHLFRWLNTPADEASLSLLRLTPLWNALLSHYNSNATEQELWESLHQQLAAVGVSGLLRHLAQICPQLTANEFLCQRFSAWLNEADAFDTAGGSLPEWLSAMEALTVRDEPQGNVIRIMTVHKAKGLEFDFVLLPQLKANAMADSTHAHLMQRCDEHGNPIAVLLKPSEDALNATPTVRDAIYRPWQAEQEFSAFCELYVAITRAKYATYVIIPSFPPPKTKKESSRETRILEGGSEKESVTGMMVQLTAEAGAEAPSENTDIAECLYLRGDIHWEKDWQARHAASPAPAAPAASEPERLNFNFPILTRSTPSGRAAAARQHSPSSKPLFFGSMNSGTNFGTLVHACFEQIGWLEEHELPAFTATADAEEAAAQQCVLRALSEPAVHQLFRRPAAPCRLYREQGIEALRDGTTWVSGQIDRLVVEYADAACTQPRRALIIDYKSDRCEPAALLPEYAPQMREYRDMVALAFGLPTEAVSVILIHSPGQGDACALSYASL